MRLAKKLGWRLRAIKDCITAPGGGPYLQAYPAAPTHGVHAEQWRGNRSAHIIAHAAVLTNMTWSLPGAAFWAASRAYSLYAMTTLAADIADPTYMYPAPNKVLWAASAWVFWQFATTRLYLQGTDVSAQDVCLAPRLHHILTSLPYLKVEFKS